MLAKYRGHIIDCYQSKDLICFAVYTDAEDGELKARTTGAFIDPAPGAESVRSQIETLKAEIDVWHGDPPRDFLADVEAGLYAAPWQGINAVDFVRQLRD